MCNALIHYTSVYTLHNKIRSPLLTLIISGTTLAKPLIAVFNARFSASKNLLVVNFYWRDDSLYENPLLFCFAKQYVGDKFSQHTYVRCPLHKCGLHLN